MLTREEVIELSQVSGSRTSLAIAIDLIGVGVLFAAVARWAWLWPVGAVLMGRQQLALAVLMHDGAHRRLYKSGALNEWIGQCFLAAPLLFSMGSYKNLHLKHHLNPLAPDDPDLGLTGGYPIEARSFYRKLLRDAFGLSYFKFIRYFLHLSGKREGAKHATKSASEKRGSGARLSKQIVVLSIVVAQLMLIGALTLAGHPWLYVTLWLLPAMTILQVLLRIRGITEHAGYTPGSDQRLNSRTLVNPLQTFFFAPHAVSYHIEHHVYPSVPFYRLPKVHRLMRERNALPSTNLYTSYGQVLAELVHKSP